MDMYVAVRVRDVYIQENIYEYIYTYTHIHIHIRIHVHIHIYVYGYVCSCTQLHTYVDRLVCREVASCHTYETSLHTCM